VGLTKSIFVYYFSIENSKKSKLEVFICEKSMQDEIFKFGMHVQIIFSSSYKNFHN
jgi:hypothetical protein